MVGVGKSVSLSLELIVVLQKITHLVSLSPCDSLTDSYFSSCPHGRCFTIMTQCFTIGAFVTSVMAITSCAAMYVRPIPEEGLPEAPREGFGYISRGVAILEPPSYQQCVFYSREENEDYFESDSVWKAGKAMSMMATGVGFIVMSTVMCT
jgi:hypothetical protein